MFFILYKNIMTMTHFQSPTEEATNDDTYGRWLGWLGLRWSRRRSFGLRTEPWENKPRHRTSTFSDGMWFMAILMGKSGDKPDGSGSGWNGVPDFQTISAISRHWKQVETALGSRTFWALGMYFFSFSRSTWPDSVIESKFVAEKSDHLGNRAQK